MPTKCSECNATGKRSCDDCQGRGRIAEPRHAANIEPSDPPPTPYQREEALTSLRATRKDLDTTLRRQSEVESSAEILSGTFEKLREEIQLLADASRLSEELRGEKTRLRTRWDVCVEGYQELSKQLLRVKDRRAAAREHLQSVEQRLEGQGAERAPAIPRDVVYEHQSFAEEYSAELSKLAQELSQVHDSRLERLRHDIGRFEAQAREENGALRRKADLLTALTTAFARCQTLIEELALEAQLDQFRVKLSERVLESAEDAAILHLDMSYFDPRAQEAEAVSDVVPSEKALIVLPKFIAQVFDRCPQVKRVRVKIDAMTPNRFGKRTRQTIQAFTFSNSRDFGDLMTGGFAGDAYKILSFCAPAPAYPRPTATGLGDHRSLIVMILVCFCLSITIVVLARMHLAR